MELKKYKLGEILDVTRGASLSGEFYAAEGEYVRLTCGNFDYQNNCFKENKAKDNLYYIGDFKPDFLMKEGDIISIDIGAYYKGYHGDSAWTYAVGHVSSETARLMNVCENALYAGLAQVKPGIRLSDISHAIEEYLTENGCTTPLDYTGHGIGTSVHEDPAVPNYGAPGRGPRLKKGMCLAIEPMAHLGKKETVTLDDGWTVITKDHSLAAHYEHTIVITDDGYRILTKL